MIIGKNRTGRVVVGVVSERAVSNFSQTIQVSGRSVVAICSNWSLYMSPPIDVSNLSLHSVYYLRSYSDS